MHLRCGHGWQFVGEQLALADYLCRFSRQTASGRGFDLVASHLSHGDRTASLSH